MSTSSTAAAASRESSGNGTDREVPETRIPWWPSLVAAALAGIVAFWGMTVPQFWFDETATISAVERPLNSLGRMLTDVDAVHGLYYFVMYPWAGVFGTSELAMRAPSAIALMITALALSRIGMSYASRYLPGRTVFVGLLIAVLGAVLPGLTWAGQEARGYAMAAMSVTVAWLCFERYARTRNGLLLVAFGLSMAAATGFSLYCIFMLPVFFIRTFRWGWTAITHVLITCALVCMSCLPLAYIGMTQSDQVSWIDLSVGDVVRSMAETVFFISPRNLNGDYAGLVMSLAPWLAALTAVILVAGFVLSRARGIMAWTFCLVYFPFAVVLAAQVMGRQFFQERYLTFTAPALILLIALAVASIPWRIVGIVVTAVFAALSFPSLLAQNGEYAKDDRYGTASEEAQRADTVIFLNPQHRGIFIAYPPDHEIADPMLEMDAAGSATLWGNNIPLEMAGELRETGSVAVVSYHGDLAFPMVEENLLDNQCTLTDDNSDSRFRVTNFECPDTLPDPAETPEAPVEEEPVTPGV